MLQNDDICVVININSLALRFIMFLQELHLTTVELQLIMKIIEFLLDVCRARAVLSHTEVQQHVDLKCGKMFKLDA